MDQIEKAIKILNEGGIIIFPTDTAFGIGCRMDNESAIARLFQIRQRPLNQATPVLVNSINLAQQYLQPIPPDVKNKLIDPFWPGALTIIMPCITAKVPPLVRGNGKNLGVRMPNHPLCLNMIKKLNIPILAPSANIHNKKTPFTLADLDKSLVNLADYVLEGECLFSQASTIIDCSVTPWKIIRQGALTLNLN